MIGFLVALGLGLSAWAGDGEPADVIDDLGGGVLLNWTELKVQVTTEAHGHGVSGTRPAVETAAREQIPDKIVRGAREIRVTSELTVADLELDAAFADTIGARLEKWVVAESRYYASGQIELVGEQSMQELLKPWTLAQARMTPVDASIPSFTGVVVDARGLDAVAAFAPRLYADTDLLYDGGVWDEVALFQTPVLYVADPSHPAAVRAGESPLFVRAIEARGADLVLDADDAIRFRTTMRKARVLGEGTVVVVIDP